MSAPTAFRERAIASRRVGACEVPAHFGDAAAEYRAARQGVAIAHRSGRELFRVAGAERASFLQGLVTSDVVGVEVGSGVQTLFLDNKGHVRGIIDLWAEADALIAATDVGFIDTALPDLRRYILAADVEITDLRAETSVLGIWGPASDALIANLGGAGLSDSSHAHVVATIGGAAARFARTPNLGAPGCEVHVATAALDEVWDVVSEVAGETAAYLGWDAAEALRIEAGVPRLGHEVTAAEFPQELHLNGAVDYQKGCYLGQETVARIHYRGQVNRLLGVLRSDSPLPVGAELLSSGKPVGALTSAVDSPHGGGLGLGLVRREQYEAGGSLEVMVDGDTVAPAVVMAPGTGD